MPLRDALTSEVRRPLLVLLVAVGLLLVTATANVASLQLARATTRRRELAIRAALGAGSARVMRQLLVESLLLGLTGWRGGLALAWLLHRLVPSVLPADFPRVDDLGIDAIVVSFAIARVGAHQPCLWSAAGASSARGSTLSSRWQRTAWRRSAPVADRGPRRRDC